MVSTKNQQARKGGKNMVRNFNLTGQQRKDLVTKIAEITGAEKKFLGVPSLAYQIGNITVDKNGVLTCDDSEDEFVNTLVWRLEQEGFSSEEAPQTATDAAPEAEGGQEADSPETEPDTGTDEATKPSFSFPLGQHRADSIANLVFTLYSKGDLINKSTGGDFFISEELKDKVKTSNYTKVEAIVDDLKNAGPDDLRGLSFGDGKVTFTGFPETDSSDTLDAWMRLAEAINKASIKQKKVLPKRNEEKNEKFAFRTWLTRIGMNGPELKEHRKIYYANLTGHTAFRTSADEEKWKKRQAEKRAELKAAKEQDNEIVEESEVDDNE